MATYDYSIKNVNLSLGGILVNSGGSTEGFITITMPKFRDSASGVHGDSVSFETGDEIAPFTLQLLEGDPIHQDLLDFINEDKNREASGIGEFLLEHLGSGLEVRGDFAFDGYPSEVKYGAEVSMLSYAGRIFGVRMQYRPRTEA